MTSANITHRKHAQRKDNNSFRGNISLFTVSIILIVILFPASLILQSNASAETFGSNIPVGRISGLNQVQPAVAVDNKGNVYAVWSEKNASTLIYTMWIAKSSNGGISFDFVKRINKDDDWSQILPSIAIGSDGKVHVVWIDRRPTNPGIYYVNSTDGGVSFNPSVRVMDASCDLPCGFSMAVPRHSISTRGFQPLQRAEPP